MFHHEDPLSTSWYNMNSPPASVQSPASEFTFDDTHHIEQPYPSPAESEPFDDYASDQSFDFNHHLAQPIPSSQDYNETHTLSDEIFQVLSSTNLNFMPMPIDTIKREYEPEEKDDVLMHDIMLCATQTIPMPMNTIDVYQDSQDLICSVPLADITNSTPQIIVQPYQNSVEMETETIKSRDGSIQQVVVEHNYISPPKSTNNINHFLNKPDDFEPIERKMSHRRRLLPLKLQLSTVAENGNENQCKTAEIINDTLDMENEKSFDLIKFIDPPEVRDFPMSLHVLAITNHARDTNDSGVYLEISKKLWISSL